MELVKVKSKYQITLPSSLRAKIGVNIGDIYEISADKDEITLKAKSLIDRGIAEGLADVKAGRTYGPFNSVDEMIASVEKNIKKLKIKK